jgi:peptidoglycan hydrolase-like protein with peptidoglycan-binding domain
MRLRRWVAGGCAAAVVAGLVVAGTHLLPAGGRTPRTGPSGPPAATAAVTRADLTTTVTVAGSLGFGTPRQLSGGPGTVTWLPSPGTVVRRGQPVYRRDDRPVLLFYGSTPLFRRLARVNTVGRDVRVLVDNLRALGYRTGDQPAPGQSIGVPSSDPVPPPAADKSAAPRPGSTGATVRVVVRRGDAVLTSRLIAAVRRWQQDCGLPPTGIVEVGDVLVDRGKLRVASVAARLSGPADGPLMTVTGTTKVITMAMGAGDAGAVRTGDAVTVTLPDGTTTPGEVTVIGTEAQPDDENAQPKMVVTVALTEAKAAGQLNAAPVQVDIRGETRKDVLAVPVGALLAVLEGGYAVQIAGGAVVPVRTGLFADGLVEVSGTSIAEGVTVVTTS